MTSPNQKNGSGSPPRKRPKNLLLCAGANDLQRIFRASCVIFVHGVPFIKYRHLPSSPTPHIRPQPVSIHDLTSHTILHLTSRAVSSGLIGHCPANSTTWSKLKHSIDRSANYPLSARTLLTFYVSPEFLPTDAFSGSSQFSFCYLLVNMVSNYIAFFLGPFFCLCTNTISIYEMNNTRSLSGSSIR